jgi:hypothetical protein
VIINGPDELESVQGEQIGQCCHDSPAVGNIAVGKPFEPDRSPCYVPIAASAAMVVENVVE